MILVTIDGRSIEAPEQTTVLNAARMAGITIPTLCDLPALKPYGSCRLCVVEIEGFRTLQSSCTLPISEGMVIRTNTPKLHEARKFILTLLFSERNHFCMFCQKSGGDCELQNSAYGEGMDHWPIQPNFNTFEVDATHPYYIVDQNRCILCRRCVRACSEMVGNNTLAIENRGSGCMLIADFGVPFGESTCIRCGTCVQVCPTGALIDRRSAYLGLDIKAEHVESICIGCSVGCGVDVIAHDNQVHHIEGLYQAPVNAGLMCEIGRYQSMNEERQRILSPMVRKNGKLSPVSMEEALKAVADRFNAVKGSHVAAVASTRLPAETLHTFRSLFAEKLGSLSVAGIEEGATTALQNVVDVPGIELNGSLDMLKEADCVVAIGVDLARSHQVAGFFIKRNLLKGTRVIVIDPGENEMSAFADYTLAPKAGSDEALLNGMMAAIKNLGLDQGELPDGFDPEKYTTAAVSQQTGVSAEALVAASREIADAKKPVFVYGKGLTQSGSARPLQALAGLARLVNSPALVSPKGKANSMAAHAYGLDVAFDPEGCQAVYVALGDDTASERLMHALEKVPFLAVQASYVSPLTDRADVVFPVEMWAEQDGDFMNMEGRLQQIHAALKAPQGVLSNTQVLLKLAESLNIKVGNGWKEELMQHAPAAVR
jgi:formate dehydrogenase major subunit